MFFFKNPKELMRHRAERGKTMSMSSPKYNKDDVIWFDNLFLGWIKVKVLHNESTIPELVGIKTMGDMHAYAVESVEPINGRKIQKWPLVAEKLLHLNPNP